VLGAQLVGAAQPAFRGLAEEPAGSDLLKGCGVLPVPRLDGDWEAEFLGWCKSPSIGERGA